MATPYGNWAGNPDVRGADDDQAGIQGGREALERVRGRRPSDGRRSNPIAEIGEPAGLFADGVGGVALERGPVIVVGSAAGEVVREGAGHHDVGAGSDGEPLCEGDIGV